MDRILIPRLLNEKEMFSVFFEFDQEIDPLLITKVLIVVNKHYPSFLIRSADWNSIPNNLKWEDFALSYNLTSDHDFAITFEIPMLIQKSSNGENQIKRMNSIHIFYGVEESTNRNCLGVNFYGNVYTDIRYDWDHGSKVDVPIDQSISAKKNRAIMTAFLKELEILLDADITEFLSPFYLNERYIHKYGITEDAKLTYNQEA